MRGRRRKVRPTPFRERNGKLPFNASGVVQIGARRFVFVDNKDPGALFEMTFDAGGVLERIHRRHLAGIAHGMLGDPEGLTQVDPDGEILVASSSLCFSGGQASDGLVRVRYAPDGDLDTEAMHGFRDWLLEREPTLAAPARREPDADGLNIEGVAWDPRAGALLFGLRGPVIPGRIAVIRVPVDARGAPWTTESLGAPAVIRAAIPRSTARLGIRDICYDSRTGEFLLLLGRSASQGKEPFQLATWDGRGDTVRPLGVAFHRSAKPEGVTAFSMDGERGVLIVDDRGGYALLRADQEKNSLAWPESW